ncbi:MAG: hypothetical protein ACRERD_14405 [Candidatus Binatia bacterium]
MIRFISLLVVFIGCTAVPLQAWQGPHDNQPLAVLEQLHEGELAHEAFSACVGSVSANPASSIAPSMQKEALTYITTISRYARRQNRGTTPWWALALYDATRAGSSTQCEAIWQQVAKQNGIKETGGDTQKKQP